LNQRDVLRKVCRGSHKSERGRTLLSAGTLDLGAETESDEAVQRLELLHGLGGVVDESETSGLATTELGAETEDGDLVLLGLVEATELLTELILGDVGAVGVEDVTARINHGQHFPFNVPQPCPSYD
jgi:hypothetical protein